MEIDLFGFANAIQLDHLTNDQLLELEKILNGIGEWKMDLTFFTDGRALFFLTLFFAFRFLYLISRE